MQLVVRIDVSDNCSGEKDELVSDFLDRGISAKVVSGGVLIKLSYSKKEGEKTIFDLPPEVVGRLIFINCSEYGGTPDKDTLGYGNVVCGLSGKPLRPYYRLPKLKYNTRPSLRERVQARFAVPCKVVSVGVSSENILKIFENNVVVSEGKAVLERIALFQDAIRIKKWRCPICGKILFSDEQHKNEDGEFCWGKPTVLAVDIPKEFERFSLATVAVAKKARCVNCRCIHYAEVFD